MHNRNIKSGSEILSEQEQIKEREQPGYLFYQLIVFLIWPLLSLLSAFKNFRNAKSRHILTFFSGFIGATFLITEGGDANRMVERFINYRYKDFTDLWDTFLTIIYLEGREVDIFNDLLFYILSRFSSDTTILFTTVALIFGYFYSKNIWILLSRHDHKMAIGSILFMLATLLIVNPTEGVNQFRFWTATQVFFLGFLQVILNNNYKYFLVCLFSFSIHFGMIVPIICLLTFMIFGRIDYVYIPLVIGSAFFVELKLDLFAPILEQIGGGYQARYEGYTADKMVYWSEDLNARAWYISQWQPVTKYMSYAALSFVYVRMRKNLSKPLLNYMSFLFIFLSAMNFLGDFPMIFRYLSAYFLTLFGFLFLVTREVNSSEKNWLVWICLLPLIFALVVKIRMMAEYLNAAILIWNPVFMFFGISETSLWEFLM